MRCDYFNSTFFSQNYLTRLQQPEVTASNLPRLTIRIPARRLQSPPLARDEVRDNDDIRPLVLQPESRNAARRRRRRHPNRSRSPCARGAVRPPRAARSKHAVLPGNDSDVADEEDAGVLDEGDEGVCAATDAQATDHTQQSLQFLNSCPPCPETQALPPQAQKFLVTIATACDSVLASKERNRATQLIEALQGHNIFVEKVSLVMTEDSLENLAIRCTAADHDIAKSDFFYMLCTIHLRVRVF